MTSSNLIEIIKIELDCRLNKNNNFISIKNKSENELLLINEETKYFLLSSDTISFKFNNFDFNLKIYNKSNDLLENINLNFSLLKISGIGEDSYIESSKNKLKIKDINSNDIIYDSNLNNITVKCILIFNIDNNNNIYPIKINKGNCGINLPYSDFFMSINDTVRIKNTFIKGRQFFLNKKAKKIELDNIKLYNIITDPSNTFFSNGFIINSYYTNLLN